MPHVLRRGRMESDSGDRCVPQRVQPTRRCLELARLATGKAGGRMRKLPVVMALVVSIVVLGVAVATATQPRGIERAEVSRGVLVGGGPVRFEPGTETVIVKLSMEPGGSTGWHGHPDGGVFIVDKGILSNYGLNGPACEAIETKAGQAYFVPPHAHHAHLGRNNGTETVELTIYYFNVPPGQPTRIDEERPKECPADLN